MTPLQLLQPSQGRGGQAVDAWVAVLLWDDLHHWVGVVVFVPVEEVLQSFALAEDQSEDGQRFAVLEVEVSIVVAVVAAAVEVAGEYVSGVVAIVVAAEQSRSNR